MQRLYIIFALYFVAFSYAAVGVINVDNSNNIYLNNFNTLANTGTSNTWTEGSTISKFFLADAKFANSLRWMVRL